MNDTSDFSKEDSTQTSADNLETLDTHDRAREAAEDQIVHDQKIRSGHDTLENHIFNIWDEYIEMSYGSSNVIRIRSDLPVSEHNAVLELLKSVPDEVDENINPFTELLCLMTIGIYKEDQLLSLTDKVFWDNPMNWSMLKVQKVVSTYLRNYKKEMDSVKSFLET